MPTIVRGNRYPLPNGKSIGIGVDTEGGLWLKWIDGNSPKLIPLSQVVHDIEFEAQWAHSVFITYGLLPETYSLLVKIARQGDLLFTQYLNAMLQAELRFYSKVRLDVLSSQNVTCINRLLKGELKQIQTTYKQLNQKGINHD